ncbi:MAG: carbamoyltransferase HypF [Bacteroidia bacterium]|nr:MAG: carbamoyltransferase HypF [Bacteroidia bacterium]
MVLKTSILHITGLVQGVGFRPHVYRLAKELNLSGEVENNNEGVCIRINAADSDLRYFIDEIRSRAPMASRIERIVIEEVPFKMFDGFHIVKSSDHSDDITGVSPDIAVCDECIEDMKSQEHRIGYPFINCTNCGPRFTIISDLPYDRSMTAMADFRMCPRCRDEYMDVNDRRFHAQPVACNQCGPVYRIEGQDEEEAGQEEIVKRVSLALAEGKIAAVKGIGGFHLICDASNERAVSELRKRKQREGKPFAVMCRSVGESAMFAEISDPEAELLSSWQRPVVILRSKFKLAHSVSNGLDTVGIILPYMPFHHLLFDHISCSALVFTSANLSDEPVIKDNSEAVEKLGGIADLVVTYNRDIYNRADDSVARLMAGKPVILRRSRGYTPAPLTLPFNTEGIFAAGAELVNAFALGKGVDAIMSQYIGDLRNQPAYDFYTESYNLLKRLFRFSPSLVVRDIHPDYLSSRFADQLAMETGAATVQVQHHHAHVAACMAENRVEGKVIGLSLDGVGLGTDGHIWGGEVMLADYTGFERRYHFDYVPILGADRVSYDAWRSELSYLHRYGLLEKASGMGLFEGRLAEKDISVYIRGLERGINTHQYSSAGRLFDAVSSLTGTVHRANYHAEAPMRLESIAKVGESGSYGFDIEEGIISFGPAFENMLYDLKKFEPGIISARFHNTVCNALAHVTGILFRDEGIGKVVLTGGTFQNNLLVSMLSERLSVAGMKVYLHGVIPPNDNGLAPGQMAIAAAMRESGLI